MDTSFLMQQVLNGLSFGALLFLLASGFTLVFGLMRIVNLAHGAYYLLGGYLGVVTTAATGNLLFGILVATVAVALLGFGTEVVFLRRLRGQELPEVLLTIGISFVIADLCLAFFGGDPMSLETSTLLTGSVNLGVTVYSKYRTFIILITLIIGIALYVAQSRSRIGAMVRAGVDNREIAGASGINIDRIFSGVFIFGAALAGFAGVIGSGLLTLRPGADVDILLFALVVVIIGGLGSVKGAAVGSILIGLIDAFSKVWIPELSYFTIFAPMAIVLVLRPTGLFGKAA